MANKMKEAILKYKMKNYEVLENWFYTEENLYVVCAHTGILIPLKQLCYWNVERQEPYVDAKASLARELEVKNGISGKDCSKEDKKTQSSL